MPLDLKPSLSGSFGEVRPNHFHSGSDFRTNQREGYPVYAVADGFISRLRVQTGGFGNAVYISHPNGYTSVYAHLQRFNDNIARVLKAYQYRIKSFDVDFPLLPIEMPVKKGDIIAWSGNTGGSAGPHLHFEVRDSKTEDILHPALFGVVAPDNIKPTISGLYMYRLNGNPFSENTIRQYFDLIKVNGVYKLNKSPVINFNGNIGFGISTYDIQAAGNKNGVFSIELQLDGKVIYFSEMERYAFADSRAVNSHMDYPFRMTSGKTVIKSFVEPGNPLPIYKNLVNNGIIAIEDGDVHNLKYVVKDVNGNASTLEFSIKYNPKATISAETPGSLRAFRYNEINEFITNDVAIKLPRGVLYDDIDFRYSKGPVKGYSAVHKIHTSLIPLHKGYELSIKADASLPAHLQSKALIADKRGISQGGVFENGFVKTNTRTFGDFHITVDTVPPVIRPVNVTDGMSVSNVSLFKFKMTDNLSGIRIFNATIDGQWVLMEYDPKSSTVWHTLEKSLTKGTHHFQFTVIDSKNNTRTYNATFYK